MREGGLATSGVIPLDLVGAWQNFATPLHGRVAWQILHALDGRGLHAGSPGAL
jgi:hypothetical protein